MQVFDWHEKGVAWSRTVVVLVATHPVTVRLQAAVSASGELSPLSVGFPVKCYFLLGYFRLVDDYYNAVMYL